MVGARGDPAPHLRRLANEYRRHGGDVREMGAAEIGIVDDDDVAWGGRALVIELDGRLHRHGHGAQVDGHMGCLRNHAAVVVEDGAGMVAPLLDVGGMSAALHRHAHLFGYRRKEMAKDFELKCHCGHDPWSISKTAPVLQDLARPSRGRAYNWI